MNKAQLIKEITSGNAYAAQIVYNEFFPLMRGVCFKIVQDEEVVNDLVHDSFVLALLSFDKLRNPNRLGEWLTTITRNVSLRYLENEHRRNTVPLSELPEEDTEIPDENHTPDVDFARKELIELIDQLPEGYRNVIRLSSIQGLSNNEIAQLLQIKPHSVSSQLSRARKLLRSFLPLLLFLTFIPIYNAFFKRQHTWSPNRRMTQENEKSLPDYQKEIEADGIPAHPSSPSKDNFLTYRKMNTTRMERIQTTTCDTASIRPVRIEPKNYPAIENYGTGPHSFSIPQKSITIRATETAPRRDRSWQFLASGASTPSLLQHVSNAILAGGNIASGTPTLLSTWEEYAEYLKSRIHEGTPEDSLTLIQIAEGNQGEIIEKENHSRPLTFNFSLSKQIGKDWNLNSGLQYSILKSTFVLGSQKGTNNNDSCYIKRTQKIHYIGIPLGISYNILSRNSFSTSASLEATMHIPVHGKLKEQYVIAPIYKKTIHVSRFTPKVQWSLGVSLGFQYRLSERWSLYAAPTFKWYIPNKSEHHTNWTENPYVFSVPFGLRLTW